MKDYFVYIMASHKMGTLYTGVTSNLIKRVYEHKNKITKGFTAEYNVNKLVYYEIHQDIQAAILREKRLKKWHRNWKLRLIIQQNPNWEDLYKKILGHPGIYKILGSPLEP